MITQENHKKLAIIVGGGPAPGINGVIHSVTIEAINNGLEVLGILDGYTHLVKGELKALPLTIQDVSRIHLRGGSILHTARTNPTASSEAMRNTVQALLDAGVSYLVSIGGDDTAFSAYKVAQFAREQRGASLQVVHVPKTIDNDVPLPYGVPTFGYETAREVGARVMMNIMEDALTGQRWFLVVTMGRKAGHLAMGIGKGSGATLTLIPEEWEGRRIRLQEVVDILATSLIMRLVDSKPYGVALVAEGVIEEIEPDDLKDLKTVERDAHGHIRLSEINFSDIVKRTLRDQLKELGINVNIVNLDLGYEMRCAPPIAYDIDYTRSLGEAAVDFLLDGGTDAIIALADDRIIPLPFESMMDPETGRTQVRKVRIDSFAYQSSLRFQIRLKPQHADDEELWKRMAAQTNLTTEQFKARFGYLSGIAARPF